MIDAIDPSTALVGDPHYSRFKEHLIATTGLAYYQDRDEDLCNYASRRLKALNLPDCASYLGLLCDEARGSQEIDKLVEQLTIGETFFFRHRECFDALRDTVLPHAIRRNQATRRLRIWSAGCSFGAEPYSLSILLRRDLAHLVAGWDISILATDINREFLARAERGCFEEWAFRGVPDELRRERFSRHGKTWTVDPKFREGVTFRHHNLVEHPFPSMVQDLFALDVILCRNVMIYFNKEVTERLVAHFFDSLVPGGWLLVGHAEPNLDTFRAYRTVNSPGAVIYQKGEEFPGLQTPRPAPRTASLPCNEPPHPATRHAQRQFSPSQIETTPPAAHCAELGALRELADAGRLDEALARCEQLLSSAKLDPAVHFYHALVLEQLGRHEETRRALRRALYLDRTYVLAHYYLGLTAQKQGQRHIAARSFRNVIELVGALAPDQRIGEADDLRAGELEKLTRIHLAALDQRLTPTGTKCT